MPTTNEEITVENHSTTSSPSFNQQAGTSPAAIYKNNFLLHPPDNDHMSSKHRHHNTHISPAIRNSYIQQNLPVRRQSLIVYHDKLRSEKKLSKSARELSLPSRRRHASIAPTTATFGRHSNKDALVAVAAEQTVCDRKHPRPKVPLTIHIAPPKAIDFSKEPEEIILGSSDHKQQQPYSPAKTLFDMAILEEQKNNAGSELLKQEPNTTKKSSSNSEPPQPTSKPIIALNDVVDSSHYGKDEKEQHHTWNGLPSPPPFSKLRNVFSRLQPNMSGNNHATSDNSNVDAALLFSAKSAKRSDQQSSSEAQRKHKKSYSTASLTVSKRRKNITIEAASAALLSHIAIEFSKKIAISTIDNKSKIHFHHDVFTGTEAVDCIMDIIKSKNRGLALTVGKALESQGLFHHVTYDCELLDCSSELYQFQYVERDDAPSYVYRLPIPPQFIPSSLTIVSSTSGNNSVASKTTGKKSASSICKTISINGVFTNLTDCYSATCSKKTPCYSYTCPQKSAQKHQSKSSVAQMTEVMEQEQRERHRILWRQSVPKSILKGTNLKEQKRQECIFELIYTEQDYYRDLQYVQNFWIKPLLFSEIIPLERRKTFINDVFWNWADILDISSALSKDLTKLQEKYTIIPCISDIMMKHLKRFRPFLLYGAHQTLGKHYYEVEKRRNTRFAQFVEKLQRRPESRRLELHGYLTKPTSRLGRYNLLLSAIYELTPNNHRDHDELPIVMAKITDLLVQLNKEVGKSDNAFYLEQISSRIISNKKYDLGLTVPNRQLLLQGIMKRAYQQHGRNNSTTAHASIIDNSSSVDIQLFLFDHLLIFCKIKKQDGVDCYKIFRKPIPLKTLSVSIPNTIIIPSSKTHIYSRLTPSTTTHQAPSSDTSIATARQDKYPISFQNTDGSEGSMQAPITLIALSEHMRKIWMDKIHEQQQKIASAGTVIDSSSTAD